MSSGGGFHRAYTNATQQAFLEAHEHTFAYFGGVFRTLRYDNLASGSVTALPRCLAMGNKANSKHRIG